MPARQSHPNSLALSLRTWLMRLMLVVLLVLVVLPVSVQAVSMEGNKIDGFPVVLDETVLFRVKHGIPNAASAEERADLINKRLATIANDPAIAPDAFQVENQADASVVKAGEAVLLTIRDQDVVDLDRSREAIAAQVVDILKTGVVRYRQERSADAIFLGIGLAVLGTVALVIFLQVVERLFTRWHVWIRAARKADRLNLRIQNLQLLGSESTSYLLSGGLQLIKMVLVLGALYLYVPFVLKQFPATRSLGNSILDDVAQRAGYLGQGFANYLPNLITLSIIGFLSYYAIGFAKLVIAELGRDDAYTWFYPEWIQPTTRLATMLTMAIALVLASPYLPGFGSPAFQGISLFLGALLTLGSSSAVANAISGIILIYTRAFRINDIIQIGSVRGKVMEKSLFVTRLLTFKQEIITIPNANVLSSHVTNFSAILREAGGHLVLYTTITLGYDAPWQIIHQVLKAAAKATTGIVASPEPFVLQTSLNDFNVAYELNAFTNCPDIMPVIYSELHQNIQDYCNQAGIEILSPAYTSLRDGNHSTIPANYLPSDYVSPGFQVHSGNGTAKPI